MGKEKTTEKKAVVKYDPNTEAFQMRAQWKKVEICKKMWFDRWSWILEEGEAALKESNAIRQEAAEAMSKTITKEDVHKSLKPVPLTSTGAIGWLANKPDCQLEIYTSWIAKPPIRLPDVWELPDYKSKSG